VHLRRAKNDRIDAALIAACAALVNPPANQPDARLAALADHLTFIEQVEEDIARLKTRLEHLRPPRHRRDRPAATPPRG
jgi:transposase